MIPEELRRITQWVCWREEPRDGKTTKVPYCPITAQHMSVTGSPLCTTDYLVARAALQDSSNRFNGVGFVFTADDLYAGVDIDNCIGDDGKAQSWAQEILIRLASYAEISPSGRGVKVFMRGEVPGGRGRKKGDLGTDGKGSIEIYDRSRFFTVTGNRLRGMPGGIEDRCSVLREVHSELFGSTPDSPESRSVSTKGLAPDDERLVETAMRAANGEKFAYLWKGDTSGHNGDDSAADLALCNLLAFYCGADTQRIDKLFRHSGLMRPKWDERRGDRTYGQMTIAKAREDRSEFCTPMGEPLKRWDPVKAAKAGQPYMRTDYGNAERLVAWHGGFVRWCGPWSKWLVWDGRRWVVDETGQVERFAKQTVRWIYQEAAATIDSSKELCKFAARSEYGKRLTEMIRLARSEPGIAVVPNQLDTNPWLLNVLNGTVDLRTGKLLPHHREDLITKLASVEYDIDAVCPRFDAFLTRVFRTDPTLVGYVQKVLGYGCTGLTSEQTLFFFTAAVLTARPRSWT